ncbi:bifunctional UDP-N-acetylmuramoyl-tripeptide:D-alanyl-D-alanine ligase/alanine racemase [Flavitalea sp.]|nr:bifunctional UDP-N-acetylmuramoyl-tripeptide:D-alanyl-D-alanine ligase/alanine racemase [Flavitalea sp.]
MNYDIEKISQIVNGDLRASGGANRIIHLLTDSRKLIYPAETLFFAIISHRRDGHEFISTLYERGVRNFVVSRMPGLTVPVDANFIVVRDTIQALQQLARYHRGLFEIPVIGITGSNGKTIVKEWLNQLLEPDFKIVRSPASYNSQIGVPLSIWQMNEKYELAIFEAGISTVNEMKKLAAIINPTIGLFTNIGEAHSEGFSSRREKLLEKLLLFKNSEVIIYRNDDPETEKTIREELTGAYKFLSWGKNENAFLRILEIKTGNLFTGLKIQWNSTELKLSIPFTDDASIENAMHCCCMMVYLGLNEKVIEERLNKLHPVEMRLELKSGINNSSVINDSYSSDLSSLRIALDFLSHQKQHPSKTVILSDILESGLESQELYRQVAGLLKQHEISRVIAIGDEISKNLAAFHYEYPVQLLNYPSVAAFRKDFNRLNFRDETILIKGARAFKLEGIDQLLQQKVHQTVLEIDLNAIVHNLNEYKNILAPGTKIMAMVKAFSYGSGSFEIANVLQFHNVDYLAVAYADEGVALRKGGIMLPIMVMNTDAAAFDVLLEYNLEPDLYSLDIYRQFNDFVESRGLKNIPVHLELETGMNRLGMSVQDIGHIQSTSALRIQSVYSHLAASEDPGFDEFTLQQAAKYQEMVREIEEKLGYGVIKHIANSSGASRHPDLQLDMVRLGIGLYGIDGGMAESAELLEVSTLKSTIAQVKRLSKDETVGYGRRGKLSRDSLIATVRIGYADGYSRKLGNGIGQMLVHGKRVPVIGSICMDMTMIDITDLPFVVPGDEVTIFGEGISVMEVAVWAETIPYEILTGVSQRVKRVYFEE